MDGQGAYLKERGFDVHCISSPGELLDKFAQREGVPVYPVTMHRAISVGADAVAGIRLLGLFRRLRPDIVHGTTPKAAALALIASRILGVPVRIYHAAGLRWWTLTGARRRLTMLGEKIGCSMAHLVICASPSVREAMVAHGLCPAEKAVVLGSGHTNGVEVEHRFNPERFDADTLTRMRAQFGIPAGAVVAGFVGRLVRDKGIEELAAAWQLVRDQVPSLHLLLVGHFEKWDPVSQEARHLLETDPRVHLAGWLEDVIPAYAAMDMCVLPSHREGLPTVALEANAMRLPVIAADAIGSVDAVVDGVTGRLVPVDNAEALAAAIRRYADDPELRGRHGDAGRERVCREFSRPVIWEELVGHYIRLLKEKGRPLPQPSDPS